ncbi:MAG: hypothetical protein KDB07_05905 [Planctomycetes bacterium]|nr:hypothetical protein [Planctomycetota bacterium]
MKPLTQVCLLSILVVSLLGCVRASTPRIVTPDATAKRLEEKIRNLLENAEHFELLTIDPNFEEGPKESNEFDSVFHDHPILGRSEVSEGDRARLVNSLYQGIAKNNGMHAMCFNPRHALVAATGEDRVELVICFECLSMNLYLNGKSLGSVQTERDPGRVFNEVAAKHNLKVDPGWKKAS